MSDLPASSPDAARPELSGFPTIDNPTVSFTAGPTTARDLTRTWLRREVLHPWTVIWTAGYLLLVIGLAGAAWGKGVAVLALLVAIVLVGYYGYSARRTLEAMENRLGMGSFAVGTVCAAQYGSDAVDFALSTMYLRFRYADIDRIELHGSGAILRPRAAASHLLPRELFPSPLVDGLPVQIQGTPARKSTLA